MAIVETKSLKKTNLKISVYIGSEERMGLENYGELLMPGAQQSEPLTCLESATGVRTYVTGLNELAPSVLNLPEKDRKAKVQQIRKDIIYLEKVLASNAIDDKLADPSIPTANFMKEVKIIRPDNYSFWDEIKLTLRNGDQYLDVKGNPYDFIKLKAIEAGSFDSVAPDYETARKKGKATWFLDIAEKTTSDKVVLSKLKNAAIAQLEVLYSKDTEKLRYVLKYLVTDSVLYKASTPNDSLYEDADAYINGRGEERTVKHAANKFIEACGKKIDDLKLNALVKDGNIYKFIITKGDGKLYHVETNSMLGANVSECMEYLKNPLNSNVFDKLQASVEAEWVK